MIGGFGGRIAGGQRKIGIGAVVALVLLLLAWAFVLDRGGEERADVRAEVADEDAVATTTTEVGTSSTTTSTSEPPSTTVGSSTTSTPGESGPTPSPTPSPVSTQPLGTSSPTSSSSTTTPATTTTTEPCLDSYEERCGEFRWASDPGRDSPATYQMEIDPARPVAGQAVVFRATVTDADATPYEPSFWRGPKGPDTTYCGWYGAAEAFGPWRVPARRGGAATGGNTFTFETAGVYTMTLCFSTVSWPPSSSKPQRCPGEVVDLGPFGWPCHDPYGEHTKVEFEVEIFPA